MEKQESAQKRREYAERGTRSGRLMSFRVDYEVAAILAKVTNKGRLLNDLVKCWAGGRDYRGPEQPPLDDSIEEYF